jgi:uncharacterized protein YxeA
MSVYRVEYTPNNKDDDSEFLDINGVINLINMYEGEEDTLSKVLENSTNISNNLSSLVNALREATSNTEQQISLLSEIESIFEDDSTLLAINIDLQSSIESDKLVVVSKEYINLSSSDSDSTLENATTNSEESIDTSEETSELLKMIDKTQYAKEMHFGQGNPFEEIQSENIDYAVQNNQQSPESNQNQNQVYSQIIGNNLKLVYTTVPTDKLEQYISLQALGRDTKAYESIDNLQQDDNESIIEVLIDTSNTIDLTNRKEYNKFIASGNSLNKPLIKRILQDNNFQCVEYLIVDNRAVREIREA